VSALATRIAEIISRDGPIPVSLYMSMCLHDPRDGYYATRAGFNRDFTTAPETSQVFGELIGLWAAQTWLAMDKPAKLNLIELGPGRGTMMRDVLRVAAAVPDFAAALDVTLVEASPLLRAKQADLLTGHAIRHADSVDAAPPGPAIILANEFLDCLPIRQFARADAVWRERQIGLGADGKLVFGLSPPVELPAGLAPSGDEAEFTPGLEALVDTLARRFTNDPGCALLIDYGPASATPTDTLRAYSEGRQVDPLADPGTSDLTADVDFARLRLLAEREGLAVYGPVAQGEFLSALGAGERLKALTTANPARADEIKLAVETLVSPQHMGERFKVIAIGAPGFVPPPGFAEQE
jgi:NADH dehydrogenase [ubiquinone] 1 alpha subcomplex assembly factor 7